MRLRALLWRGSTNGQIVAAGQSYDQNYEILELPAGSAATFYIKAKKYAWNWCSQLGYTVRYGFAYDIH